MHVITFLAFQNEVESLEKSAVDFSSLDKNPDGSYTETSVNRLADAHKNRRQAEKATMDAVDAGAEARRLRSVPKTAPKAFPKGKALAGVAAAGLAAYGGKKLYDHVKGKKKEANHGIELAGLGMLAAPSVAHLGGKDWSEKNKARAEVAGLGVLAAPSAMAVAKKGVGKLKAVARASNVSKLRSAAMGVAKHASLEKDAVSPEWIAGKARSGAMKRGLSGSKSPEVSKKTLMDSGSMNIFKDSSKTFRDFSRHSNANVARGAVSEGMKDASKLKSVGKAGAGVAAAAVIAYGAKKLYDRLKKKEAAPSMSAMMNMHRLADSAKAMKNVAKPAAAAAVKLPNQAAQAARATSLAGHTAQGGHAWNPAAQAKRAISL